MVETLTVHSPEDSFLENTMTAEAKILERIEAPSEGGRLAHFRSHSYPEKYIPTPMRIYLVDSVKRTLMACLKLNWRLVLAIKQEKTLKELLWHSLRHISWRKGFEDKYCDMARELYRTGMKLELDEKWVNIVCLILEYDNWWRYVIQDLFGELDKILFDKNPVRELKRLALIASERVQEKSISKKILNVSRFLFLLYFLPKTKRLFKKFLNEIDIKKVKQSIEDVYWSSHWGIYDFSGLSFENRLKRREVLKQAKPIDKT